MHVGSVSELFASVSSRDVFDLTYLYFSENDQKKVGVLSYPMLRKLLCSVAEDVRVPARMVESTFDSMAINQDELVTFEEWYAVTQHS